VVSPSSSCVGAVREQYPVLAREAGDDRLERDSLALAARMFELSEFLVRRLGVEDVGATFRHRVTYHPTCHSQRVTRVGDAPLRLLRAVRGLELVDLPEATECCGFGGTFSIKNADTSLAMLADKCASIAATGAAFVTAVDPSCLLHIGGGLSRRGTPVRAVHLAQILAAEGSR
jgi:L-lactate dehydrogenase complex protein LldE